MRATCLVSLMAVLAAMAQGTNARACASDEGLAPGVHVAADGDDAGDGSTDHPFATLEHAVSLLRAGPWRRIYLEPGELHPVAALVLDGRDDGSALVACPEGGAGIDGGGTLASLVVLRGARGVRLEGVSLAHGSPEGVAIALESASGIVLDRLRIEDVGTAVVLDRASGNVVSASRIAHVRASGIEAKNASDDNLIDANVIEDVAGSGTEGGGVFFHGASRTTVSRNLVSRTGGIGIGFLNWDDRTVNRDNVVRDNVVRDADLASTDSGSIYVLGRSRVNTRMVITGNLVDGTGRADQHSVGIYLDDSTTGVQVSGNVVRRVGSDAVQIHGGSDNQVAGNILDLGEGRPSAVLFQAAPADTDPDNRMTGNVVRGNVIVSSSPQPRAYAWIDGGAPSIAGNLYYDTLGVPMQGEGPATDVNPAEGDPRFVGEGPEPYALAPGSTAAQIGFLSPRLSAMGPPGQ